MLKVTGRKIYYEKPSYEKNNNPVISSTDYQYGYTYL